MIDRPDNNNPRSYASVFRRRRFQTIERILNDIVGRRGYVNVLDVGGRRNYWALLSTELSSKVRITFLNLAAELDVGRLPPEQEPLNVTYGAGDACAMPQFTDASFDLVHSNSVIEHVGSLQNMIRFAGEIRRVGIAYYVQTPYLWFPLEPHYGVPFVHWLPAPTRAQLLSRFKVGYAERQPDYLKALSTVDHTHIVDMTLMRRLFPDGVMFKERFALMTKSITMVRWPRDEGQNIGASRL